MAKKKCSRKTSKKEFPEQIITRKILFTYLPLILRTLGSLVWGVAYLTSWLIVEAFIILDKLLQVICWLRKWVAKRTKKK